MRGLETHSLAVRTGMLFAILVGGLAGLAGLILEQRVLALEERYASRTAVSLQGLAHHAGAAPVELTGLKGRETREDARVFWYTLGGFSLVSGVAGFILGRSWWRGLDGTRALLLRQDKGVTGPGPACREIELLAQAVEDLLAFEVGVLRAIRDLNGGEGAAGPGVAGALGGSLRLLHAHRDSIAGGLAECSGYLAGAGFEFQEAHRESRGRSERLDALVGALRAELPGLRGNSSEIGALAAGVSLSLRDAGRLYTQVTGERATLLEIRARILDFIERLMSLASRSELLALSAALEGTRHAVHGRVQTELAVELRALAERLRSSAENVRVEIDELARIAERTRTAIDEASAAVQDTHGTAERIREISANQAAQIEQMATAIQGLGATAVQAAAGDRDVGKAAATLQQNGEHLIDLVASMVSTEVQG